ncbi:MAG TPA: histidine kinase [Cytophagales bacterium]|nr:histidine kinase [Cytophagales bacterium]
MQRHVPRFRVALLHIAFWCVYLTFSFYEINTHSSRSESYSIIRVLFFSLFELSFLLLPAYLNYFIFLPRWLEKKNVIRYILEFSIPFILIVILRVYLQRYLVDGYSHQFRYFYSTLFIVQVVSVTLFISFFVGMLRFASEWFEFEATKKEVENERLLAELNFLKEQINPHFLFNTLNNLYYLAYTKSPNTTEVIAKLSQMMRYMIYDSNHPKVILSKEIEYMENYISLERLRLNNQIPIDFSIRGNPDQAMIAPLILITFLENAFKHGVSNNNPDSWVKVLINISDDQCLYKVENSKLSESGKHEQKSGIGLQNVKRRLELSYPEKYTLTVEDHPQSYSVELILNLKNPIE